MRASLAVIAAMLLAGCGGEAKREAAAFTGGDPDRGAATVMRYGCGSCHVIPGIVGAHGMVGPTLASLRSRVYVAGALPNQPSSLEHWIEDPHAIHAQTAMPTLGVTAQEATDIVAYLYSLK